MDPLISVIIPVYNVEKYLDKCVESVVNQTYKNLEIILVDDGSPDRSSQMCDDWAKKDSRIRVIHKENGGVSSARNEGIDAAKGEYIAFVDSDDYIDEKMYATMLSEDNAHYDLIECGYYMVVNNAKRIVAKSIDLHNNSDCVLALLDEKIEASTCNKLYRRSIVDGLRFNTDKKVGEDFLFNFYYISKINSFISIDIPFYYYDRRFDSASYEYSDKFINRWVNTKSIIDDVDVSIKKQVISRYIYELFCCLSDAIIRHYSYKDEIYINIQNEIIRCKKEYKEVDVSGPMRFKLFLISFPKLYYLVNKSFQKIK